MSIASEITRIAGLRDTIRSKLVNLGIITDSAAKLSACSEAIDSLNLVTPSTSATTIKVTPTISAPTTAGVVTVSGSATASVTPTTAKGYTKGTGTAGTITVTTSGTKTVTTLGAKTYTPTTNAQTISAGRWLTGTQTIAGDANLVAANIKSGKSIFGVTGSSTGKINTGTSIMRSSATKKFYTNLAQSSSRSSYYVTLPFGGTLPFGVMVVLDSSSVVFTTLINVSESGGSKYLYLYSHGTGSTVYRYYVKVEEGATTIDIPVTPSNSTSQTTFTYYAISGVA